MGVREVRFRAAKDEACRVGVIGQLPPATAAALPGLAVHMATVIRCRTDSGNGPSSVPRAAIAAAKPDGSHHASTAAGLCGDPAMRERERERRGLAGVGPPQRSVQGIGRGRFSIPIATRAVCCPTRRRAAHRHHLRKVCEQRRRRIAAAVAAAPCATPRVPTQLAAQFGGAGMTRR